jgi:hypothetical protein
VWVIKKMELGSMDTKPKWSLAVASEEIELRRGIKRTEMGYEIVETLDDSKDRSVARRKQPGIKDRSMGRSCYIACLLVLKSHVQTTNKY